jgi:hypothetical protein
MRDIGPGDLVICIDDRPCQCSDKCGVPIAGLVKHRAYRIKSIDKTAEDGIPRVDVGLPPNQTHKGSNVVGIFRFKPLNDGPDDDEIIAMIRKPGRLVVTTS